MAVGSRWFASPYTIASLLVSSIPAVYLKPFGNDREFKTSQCVWKEETDAAWFTRRGKEKWERHVSRCIISGRDLLALRSTRTRGSGFTNRNEGGRSRRRCRGRRRRSERRGC